jgi:hypothetical protein
VLGAEKGLTDANKRGSGGNAPIILLDDSTTRRLDDSTTRRLDDSTTRRLDD